MANTYLTRTQVAGNRQTFTQSFWFKLSNTGDQALISTFNDSNNYNYCYLDSSTGQLSLQWKKSGSVVAQKNTSRVFRDFSAWYNVVYAVDTTQASGGDRIKLYINGELQTEFSSNIAPGQITTEVNDNGTTQYIGSLDGSQQYFNGSMSYVAQIDGTAELPGIFGETDSTTGEWKIKTTITPSVAWGNNGFLILKNGNSLTDESSNSNNWTLGGGTLTNTEDCPSNIFSTINVQYNQTTGQGVTVTFGNNLVYYGSNSSRSCIGDVSPSSGKYYYEAKVFDNTNLVLGIVNLAWGNLNGASGYAFHDDALNFGYDLSGQKTSGGTATAFGSAMSNNDIFMCAMDLDNQKLYFGLNGTWQGSGDPTSGATGTGSAFNLASGANYAAACRLRNGTQVGFNFGNGYYSSSSQVSSAGTNASGIGIFEYDVPNGYTALSTKGLNL